MRHILFIFLPALLFASIGFGVQFIRSRPPQSDDIPGTPTNNTVQIPIFPEDPLLGDKKAAHTIIVFADFACEACRTEARTLFTFLGQYPTAAKVVWKGLPVTRIPFSSEEATRYGICAQAQGKFLVFADAAFTNFNNLSTETLSQISTTIGLDDTKLRSCLADPATTLTMSNTEAIADVFNVQSVPTIFLNNKQIAPPRSVDGWKALLGV